jgi:hypothetical protein
MKQAASRTLGLHSVSQFYSTILRHQNIRKEVKKNMIKKSDMKNLTLCSLLHFGFLLFFCCYPEGEGEVFLRNVGCLSTGSMLSIILP